MRFLKENWVWILAPLVGVIIVIVVILVLSDSGPTSDFIYNLD